MRAIGVVQEVSLDQWRSGWRVGAGGMFEDSKAHWMVVKKSLNDW